MDNTENVGARQSRIPHPRALLQMPAASGLQTMTEAGQNSRQPCDVRFLGPTKTGTKRSHPEPQSQLQAKRQTLSNQAGDIKNERPVSHSNTTAASSTSIKGRSIGFLASNNPKSAFTSSQSLLSSYQNRNASSRSRQQLSSMSVGAAQLPPTTRARPATSSGQYAGQEKQDVTHPAFTKSQNSVLNVDERLREVESQFFSLKDVMSQSFTERKSLEDVVALTKSRANELQRQRDQLEEKNVLLQKETESLRCQFQSAILDLESERREKNYTLENQAREHRRELDDLRRNFTDTLSKQERDQQDVIESIRKKIQTEAEDAKKVVIRELQETKARHALGQQDLHLVLRGKDMELQQSHFALDELQAKLNHERSSNDTLHKRLAEAALTAEELECRTRALQAQVDFLKSDSRQQSDQFAAMEARMQQALATAEEARQKLMKEETERRILFNKYQELKGNIRVMCRVRPASHAPESEEAKIAFTDAKTSSSQIAVSGPEEKSSFGIISRKIMPFEFDRVFSPSVRNEEIFDEISQLVQSALDGYNVCIFCYGQTGSGKTYTMSSPDGMITRATHMIYDNIKTLEEKSWVYTMEGSFVEVYNEELHDLLVQPWSGGSGKELDTRKKLEIRHDEVRKVTTVVNCKVVRLDSVYEVESMLRLAQNNRSVASTKSNERSSRSHSIFILRLVGENTETGEHCEGTLNLVDLAGSERLKQSGAEGDRKKETQNINKSLACLGDVIEALGRGAPHIPYRNSKLTHLLQYSLGGNSKTLMFVMISPLEEHLKETLTSLRFATKVYNTHIGTAKSSKKAKENETKYLAAPT